MAIWITIFAFLCQISSSSSIVSIFPPHYSQRFNYDSVKSEVQLSEAVLGEKKYTTFGISLWVKITKPQSSGDIFRIQYGKENQWKIPCLSYSWINYQDGTSASFLSLQLYDTHPERRKLHLSIAPSDGWIFIAISASHERNSLLFYCNNLGVESHILGVMDCEVTLLNAILEFGGLSIAGRIGDFKIYNDIYNEISDWQFQYSSSCLAASCDDLFPSINYGKCDLWCSSQTEFFLSLFDPSLFSKVPYLTLNSGSYEEDIINIYTSKKDERDYSITGWFQIPDCKNQNENILEIGNLSYIILTIMLTSSSSSSTYCDILEAKILSINENSYSENYDSVQITSQNYIGNWFFFAVTLDSNKKLLTIYSQNGINPPSASFPLIKSSVTYAYSAQSLMQLDTTFIIGGNKNSEAHPRNFADFRIYPGSHADATLVQYNNNIFSPATYLDPYCISWESIWYCQSCIKGYFIKNGLCKECHPSCDSCSSGDTEADCLSCVNGYYAQPGYPSLCFDYCPLGYAWDSSINQCIGTQGIIANINFDDNLSGDFTSSYVYVLFGLSSGDYYPNFEFWIHYLQIKEEYIFLSDHCNSNHNQIFKKTDYLVLILL